MEIVSCFLISTPVSNVIDFASGSSDRAVLRRLQLLHFSDLALLALIALMSAVCLTVSWRDFDQLRSSQQRSQHMIRLAEQALLVSARADAAGLSESAVIYAIVGERPSKTRVVDAAARFSAAQSDFQAALNGLIATAHDDEWTLELIEILKREQAKFVDVHKSAIKMIETDGASGVIPAREILADQGWRLSESISALTQTITLNYSRRAQLSHAQILERMNELRTQLVASVLGAIALVALLGWLSNRVWRTTSIELQRLQRQSATDSLTSLPNRRAFRNRLGTEIERAKRDQLPLVLVAIDLDYFKRFNDAHGHPAGDALLKDLAAAWRPLLRDSDMLARVGGEEFAVLMPNCRTNDVEHLLARLRTAMPRGQTFSAGIAKLEAEDSASQLIARADAALYQAKDSGRDRASHSVELALVS
jgi:diguanylate cyclase (GGDEF)-like protein